LWGRWVCFLDRREQGTTLSLFRIACGLCTFGAIGAVVASGAAPTLWLNPQDGGYTIVATPRLFRLLGGVNPMTLWSMIAVSLTASLLTALGLGGRVTAFIALQAFIALVGINPDAVGSYDLVLSNGLWLLVLARATTTLSLDCRLRTGRWLSDVSVPAWPRYVAIYQLVLIYWSTGMHKLGAAWTPVGGFSALYYTLQQPTWQRWDMSWLAWAYPLTQIATAVTWIWELTAPLLLLALWYRATSDRPGRLRALINWLNYRRWFVVIGLAVHLGIFAFMEVGPFTWIMLAFYVCLYRPEELQGLLRKLGQQATVSAECAPRPAIPR
jgi:hypothetical protein